MENILISKNWKQVIHAVISLSYYYYFYILWFIKKSLLIDHQTAQEFHKRGGWGLFYLTFLQIKTTYC